jgi:lysophospholipase L1-like esterase
MKPLFHTLIAIPALVACAPAALSPLALLAPVTPQLIGVAAIGGPLAHATISVRDSQGASLTTQADARGRYSVGIPGLIAPLVVIASSEPGGNCRYTHTLRALCLTALVPSLANGENTVNINPLTDQITSDVATALHFIGPQQLADAPQIPAIPAHMHTESLRHLRAGFATALTSAGVPDADHFNPVTAPMQANGNGVDAVLRVVNHNRGYDNETGEASATVLTDMAWRPIARPFGPDANEPLQYARSRTEREGILSATIRIFIVGDSTAATYERQRLPRMGWGQVFSDQLRPGSGIAVVNGARAGRSSRDFYNGGWYRQMARFMQPGDYVFIAHGHNDQNCNGLRAARGVADITNLCTYPNGATGQRQHPPKQEQMSFQSSLENYIADARAKGAYPILMTPTTRFLNADRKTAYVSGDARPVVSQHLTRQNAVGGYAFVGDYSQTIKDTAQANRLPLIDLEAKTIAFANAHAHDWQNYWLVVSDTVKYPWYATQTAGTPSAPDTTHFQEAGARAMATMVADGLRETPELHALAQWLKPSSLQ